MNNGSFQDRAKGTPLGRLIRARRQQLGLTQAQLAELTRVTDSAVSLWETGVTTEIQPETLERVAVALRMSVDDLVHPGAPLREAMASTATELASALRGARAETLLRAQREVGVALLEAIIEGTLTSEDLATLRSLIETLISKNRAARG